MANTVTVNTDGIITGDGHRGRGSAEILKYDSGPEIDLISVKNKDHTIKMPRELISFVHRHKNTEAELAALAMLKASDGPIDVGPNQFQATDAQIATYKAAQNTARSSGQSPKVLWNDGTPELPTDDRQAFTIATDVTIAQVVSRLPISGIPQKVVLTATAIGGGDLIDKTYQETEILVVGGKNLYFDFTNGVATQDLEFNDSFDWDINSTAQIKLKQPLVIRFVE